MSMQRALRLCAMEQPSASLLNPRARRPRPFPRLTLLVIGASFLLAVANPAPLGAAFRAVDLALKLVAAASACVIAGWLEERVYASQVGRGAGRRIGVGVGVLASSLLAAPALGVVFGVTGALVGDDGTSAVCALVGCLWLASAALGSLVVLVLDVAVSALLPDLRSRFQVAVLGLLAIVVGAAAVVFRIGGAVATRIEALELSASPLEGAADSRLVGWLVRPEAPELATTLFFVCAAAIAFPAVLSACGKLAEMVMVRLHPLRLAFRSLAQGDFEARVDEGGSRELRELGQSFNQMAASLVEAREEVQRLNEGLENQVATRTRELRAAVEELKQAQTRLIETEKQVMLSRLTAGLLHEVNSPLGALRSATDTIRRSSDRILVELAQAPPHPRTPELLRSARASASLAEVVLDSTRRIEELMASLRRFVSLDSSERKTVDVRSGVQAALVMVRPLLGDRISVAQDWPEGELGVYCFPARLNQVFLHLLQNAAEAMADRDTGSLSVAARSDGETLTITIADDGRGMDEQKLAGLFEFGFTEKEGGRVGLRLGLPSSKRWVEEIGGSIDVSSVAGKGTTVAVRLPLARA